MTALHTPTLYYFVNRIRVTYDVAEWKDIRGSELIVPITWTNILKEKVRSRLFLDEFWRMSAIECASVLIKCVF